MSKSIKSNKMNLEGPESSGFSLYRALLKILQPCCSLLTNLRVGHPVHPSEPVTPHYIEYLMLNPQKRLRIIHVKGQSNKKKNSTSKDLQECKQSNLNSMQEEYWFTRWSKPLKLHNCSCLFRESQRFSSIPTLVHKEPVCNIKKIEGFVELLIQETLIEAFHESSTKITTNSNLNVNKGTINLGFEGDEYSDVVHPSSLKKSCNHKKKPIILFLHGIGDSADIWWSIITTFTQRGFEIIAPDMLGHGYSSVPNNAADYKFESILQYTLAVFDHYIGNNELNTCIIVAHSYGCSLATALCQHRSQQIIQLILISGGGPTPLSPPTTENEIPSIHCLHTLIKPLLFCGVQRTILYPLRGKHFEVCNPNNGVPNYILKYIINGQNWPDGDASFHRRILIPTLLVHGLLDNKVTLVQECEMERTIPRAFLELIPNAGHMSMLETPESLGHMITCFIEWWSNGDF